MVRAEISVGLCVPVRATVLQGQVEQDDQPTRPMAAVDDGLVALADWDPYMCAILREYVQ
jgi:hypothetical protein